MCLSCLMPIITILSCDGLLETIIRVQIRLRGFLSANQHKVLRGLEAEGAVSGGFVVCALIVVRHHPLRANQRNSPFLNCNSRKSRPYTERRITAPVYRGEALTLLRSVLRTTPQLLSGKAAQRIQQHKPCSRREKASQVPRSGTSSQATVRERLNKQGGTGK